MPAVAGAVDPAAVRTRKELADALNALRKACGYSYEAMVRVSRDSGGVAQLARSTVSDVLAAKTTPRRDTLLAILRVCGVQRDQFGAWLEAWQRVMIADSTAPCGTMSVRDADPRCLGVHAAIAADRNGVVLDDLPAYVWRVFDGRLRAAVTAGCFLLLVGSSSVGKTRSAYEAIRACVPDWQLVHPPDTDAVQTLAQSPPSRTVVWLDELQRYLSEPSITDGSIRALQASGAIVVGTIWPEFYLQRSVHASSDADGHRVLKLATVIDVADTLTDEERQTATTLADSDSRLRAALSITDVGPIQVLAAGPALVRRWVQAPDPYAKAVITSAVDARRMGAWSALSDKFFAAAVIGYLTPVQKALAPADWLDTALAYALTPVQGAATTLTPIPATGRMLGVVAGHVVADYLLEHAQRTRRTTPVPDACWEALLEHMHDREDLHRLARASTKRMQCDRAERFYRRLTADGDEEGMMALADLLREQGRVNEEITVAGMLAAANPDLGTRWLANALRAAGRFDEAAAILAPPDAGFWCYAQDYVETMTGVGRRDEAIGVLRARAVEHVDAVHPLADHLGDQGADDELWALFQRYPQLGYLAWEAGWIRLKAGRLDEGLSAIRTIADSDPLTTAETFARLLMENGRIEELKARARAGDRWSAWQLADWLCDNAASDDLADLADRYGDDALLEFRLSDRLVEALFEQGDTDALRVRADAGCRSAAYRWAELMIDRGRIEEVRTRADAGEHAAAVRLAQMYERAGSLQQAIKVLHDHPDLAYKLAGLLAKADRVDEAIEVIRPLAAQHNEPNALYLLHALLVRAGRDDELRSLGAAGDLAAYTALAYSFERTGRVEDAIEVLTVRFNQEEDGENRGFHLAELLQREGRVNELLVLADQGSRPAERHAAAELAARESIDELLRRVRMGDGGSYRSALLELLAAQDRVTELREFVDQGDRTATRHYLGVLARQGRIAELRAEVEAGTDGAAELLAGLSATVKI
ncbi:helix-turn-helix domain-containing protein [Micromonospora echinospora]|uniref:tetratricopeptide repeat protein n=1 Tax=Micromonospora echinospora TaxID=1877 RepID=UPI003671B5BA